jgi:hypothetical protein
MEQINVAVRPLPWAEAAKLSIADCNASLTNSKLAATALSRSILPKLCMHEQEQHTKYNVIYVTFGPSPKPL